jgi:signal transduction histidine kinase/CheY-like chemotaxis protein
MYEDLIAQLATRFADLDRGERNTGIFRALECVRVELGADTGCIHLRSECDGGYLPSPEWWADRQNEGNYGELEIRRALSPDVLERLQNFDIACDTGTAIEKSGVEEKNNYSVMVPLSCHGQQAGVLILDWRQESDLARTCVAMKSERKALRVVGDLFAGAIEQVRVDESLRQTKERLQATERYEALGQLSGGVAHDVNNLLGAIIGSCDLMSSDLANASSCQEDLDEIRLAAERASSLVGRVLSFGHRDDLQPRIIDLNWAVAGMEKLIDRVVGREVDVVLDLKEGCGFVRADPGQIDRILLNLVVNARDAMSAAGTLTIRVREREIGAPPEAPFPAQTAAGKYVELSVRDSGCGMNEKTKARVFEPFFSTKGRVAGTGLGLANVSEVTRELRGTIGVESELGSGSTFSVLIPRADESGVEFTSDDGFPKATGGSETILVVEEERVVRNLLRRVLEHEGYTVLEAGDHRAAVDVAERYQGPIHLVITDLSLPHLRGHSLITFLQRQHPELKALFTSCHSESAVRDQGTLDASIQVIEKPFGPLSLSRGVRRAIEGCESVETASARVQPVSRAGMRTPEHPRTRSNANHRGP